MGAPSLFASLAYETLTPAVRKGLFGSKYVLFGDYLSRAQYLYEICSALGYTYRNSLSTFLELSSQPGRGDDVANYVAIPAAERLRDLKEEPVNFYELFFESEAKRVMKKMEGGNPREFSIYATLPKAFKQKLSVDFAMVNMQMIAAEAVGLGGHYPELLERFSSFTHDTNKWRFAYEHGLDIGPEPPKTIPISERASEAKLMIAPFVKMVRPDLLESLGLQGLAK